MWIHSITCIVGGNMENGLPRLRGVKCKGARSESAHPLKGSLQKVSEIVGHPSLSKSCSCQTEQMAGFLLVSLSTAPRKRVAKPSKSGLELRRRCAGSWRLGSRLRGWCPCSPASAPRRGRGGTQEAAKCARGVPFVCPLAAQAEQLTG